MNNSVPLFIPLIALLILRQKIDHIMWIPILVGFLGVYLVAAPKTIMLNYPSILALCSGLFFAGVLTVSKYLVSKESVSCIIFYYFVFSAVFSGLALFWTYKETSLINYFIMFVLGCLFVAVQALLNLALRFIKPTLSAILFYSCVVFGLAIDWIIWQERLKSIEVFGLLLICLMSSWAILINRKTTNP